MNFFKSFFAALLAVVAITVSGTTVEPPTSSSSSSSFSSSSSSEGTDFQTTEDTFSVPSCSFKLQAGYAYFGQFAKVAYDYEFNGHWRHTRCASDCAFICSQTKDCKSVSWYKDQWICVMFKSSSTDFNNGGLFRPEEAMDRTDYIHDISSCTNSGTTTTTLPDPSGDSSQSTTVGTSPGTGTSQTTTVPPTQPKTGATSGSTTTSKAATSASTGTTSVPK